MRTPEQIRALYEARRKAQSPMLARALEVRDTYNGDIVVPLPEIDKNEKPAVANLVQSAIDQTGMRIASVMPGICTTPTRHGRQAAQRAQTRRDVLTGWWDAAHVDDEAQKWRMDLLLRQRARWLLAYGHAPVVIRPGLDGQPRWQLYDPLSAYPAPTHTPGAVAAEDCLFAYKRTRADLVRDYPEAMARLAKLDATTTFTVIEYFDREQCATFVTGDADNQVGYGFTPGTPDELLHWYPNRTGRPVVFDPARITLDRNLGAYDGMVGMYQLQAKMMALSVIGMQRGIYPEEWLVSANGQGNVVRHADPQKGVMGIVENGQIATVKSDVNYQAMQLVNQLGENARQEGNAPFEYSGLSPTNTRTARRGEQVMSAAIDFFIQEAQGLLERSLEAENRAAIATVKAWSARRQFSMYVKGRGKVTYTPTVDFEVSEHEVRYAYTGADANGVTIQDGQKLAMGTKSRRTVMENDPSVRDVEQELDRINGEKVTDAFMSMVQTLAATPDAPVLPSDFAKFTRLVVEDKAEPFDAWETIQADVQKRQAAAQAQAAAQPPPGAEQMGPMPEQMPGADANAAERLAQIAPPNPSQENLTDVLANLRLPQMTTASER